MDEKTDENPSEKSGFKHKIKHAHSHIKKTAPFFAGAFNFIKKYAVIFTLLLVLFLQFMPNGDGTYPWGGLWMRIEAEKLHFADDAAQNNVDNFIRSEASRLAAEQYPNLPDDKREKVVQDVMKKVRSDYGDRLESEKANVAKEIRSHFSYESDGQSFVYMPDIDTYFYLRYARNIIEKGHLYDVIKDNVPWDNHMLAPLGVQADKTLHPLVISWLYKVNLIFNKKTTLMQSMAYFPIVFMFFSIIFAYLIGWRISGNFGGFFAATLLALTPSIFGRTIWGHGDTDAYNVFFPLLCSYLIIEAMISRTYKKQAFFALLSGLAVALYTQFWAGWWYVFDFMLGALIIGFIWSLAKNYKLGIKSLVRTESVKKYVLVGSILLLTSCITITFLMGFESYVNGAFKSAVSFTTIKEASLSNLWPNVLTTVAELNPIGFFGDNSIISSLGGIIMFVMSVFGILLLLVKGTKDENKQALYAFITLFWLIGTLLAYSKNYNLLLLLSPIVATGVLIYLILKIKENKSEKIFYSLLLAVCLFAILFVFTKNIEFILIIGPVFIVAIGLIALFFSFDEVLNIEVFYAALLLIWFAGSIYAALKGIRFILLLGPGFAIAFGICTGLIYDLFSKIGKKVFHVNKLVTATVLIFIFSLIIIGPFEGSSKIVKSDYNSLNQNIPLVNDAWWNVLTKIKEESAPDAIINSWWDFGHHFKYIADRAVTFDGASQTTPQAHWIGDVLQTADEEEAVAILRMLDCGANTAYDIAMKKINDPLISVNLVKKIIMVDKDEALAIAHDAGVSEDIVKYTHCSPPEDYFIASGDMVGKSGVWSHFGSWNFEYAEVWQKWKFMEESDAVPGMMKRFNWTEEKAADVYNQAVSLSSEEEANAWISPWNNYIASPQACSTDKEMINCNSVRINRSNNEVEVSVNGGIAKPGQLIVYDRKGNVTTVNISGGTESLSVVVWPNGENLYVLPSLTPLVNSMFTRMFFMNGLGLKHFKPFTQANQLVGGQIFVYKVDWEGSEPYIPENLKPKNSVVDGTRVRVNYIGWTDDGIFDSSIVNWRENNVSEYSSFDEFDTNPLAFTKGKGQLIPGFEQGMENMTVGQSRTIVIPPEKAYGTDPEKHPLGNKTLTFRVHVESVE